MSENAPAGGGGQPSIRVSPDVATLADTAAQYVTAAAEQAIADRGAFHIALAGGSTPKALYERLTAEPYRDRIDWSRVHVFFGDERCVPPDDPESNYRMARESLLTRVPIPGDNVYRMRGEAKPPEVAAIEYGRLLKERFGETGGVDVCLLGMGDDGHTASLFPHTPALAETRHRCVAQFVEKSTTGASWRITLTAPFINRSGDVLVMVTGAKKAQRLDEVLTGPRDPDRLPIQLIQPNPGRLTWLLDAAAAGM